MTRTRTRLAVALLAAMAASGCATMRMAVPPTLATAPEWSVRPRNPWRPDGPLRVGPYEAHHIDRDGVRQRGGIVDALKGKTEFQQRYEFLLRDTTAVGDLWAVRCDNRDIERGFKLGSVELSLDDRTSLECSLQPPGEPARAWTLRIGGKGDGAPGGTLRRDEVSYEIEGENPPGGQTDCCGALGYVVRRDGRVIGAVEQVQWGRVRVAPEVGRDEGSLLAATAVALILQSKLIQES
jgi:hypothetical protein